MSEEHLPKHSANKSSYIWYFWTSGNDHMVLQIWLRLITPEELKTNSMELSQCKSDSCPATQEIRRII